MAQEESPDAGALSPVPEIPSVRDHRSVILVERAAMDLRRGWPVVLKGEGTSLIAAVEGLEHDILDAMRDIARASGPESGQEAPTLLLTHPRAKTLSIRLYTDGVVGLPVDASQKPSDLMAIADPSDDLATPFKGPFQALRTLPRTAMPQAIRLAKIAGLLPSVITVPLPDKAEHKFVTETKLSALGARDIDDYDLAIAESLSIVSQAQVPLADAPNARLVAFRARSGGPEHYAIVIGTPHPDTPVLVRLHSECFTGDLLGSLKCDCGDQLRGAIKRMGEEGQGILLYLAQEGRGIGLMNKLRAYALQDQGFDTVEANERLGFEVDERAFQPAAEMLKRLGHTTIRLLSNNPAKADALARHGITVSARETHVFPTNPHNAHYMRVKAAKTGHDLDPESLDPPEDDRP